MQNADNLKAELKARNNSLTDFVSGLTGTGNGIFGPGFGGFQALSQPWTLRRDVTAGLLTLDWVTLSNSYAHIGLVQTLIDQPVEDAFRGGFKIESCDQLDEDDIQLLVSSIVQDGDLHELMQSLKWARLFGGSGLLVDNGQEPSEEFSPKLLKKGEDVFFVAADRWELLPAFISLAGYQTPDQGEGQGAVIFGGNNFAVNSYTYYNLSGIVPSRVHRVNGVPAPKFIRQQLQGWGMSELERCLREINSFLKFQDLIFELIDEAKVDVYKIEGFNEALASSFGTEMIQQRVHLANALKNYKSALVMDKQDEYTQKQLGTVFNGLAAIYEQLRMNLSAALKIPMGKLFGTSASGLNANGEDAIENYNALVETVRQKAQPLLRWVIDIRCQTLFGFIPEYTVEFASLRVMSAKDEEGVKTSKQARAMALFAAGAMDVSALEETLTKDGLLSVKLKKDEDFDLERADKAERDEEDADASTDKVKNSKNLSKLFKQ
jgi:uncharacterized protein